MFTGIIQHRGRVAQSRTTPAGRSLIIDTHPWGCDIAPGDKIGRAHV